MNRIDDINLKPYDEHPGPAQLPTIFSIRVFVDDKGRHLEELTSLDESVTRYVGSGMIPVSLGGNQGTINFKFDVPGTDIIEAFENLDGTMQIGAQKAREDFDRQLRENQMREQKRIVLPGM